MKTQTFILQLLLLALTTPAWGQDSPAAPEARTAKPLNLSLPKDLIRSPPASFQGEAVDDPVARNLRPEAGRKPYGSGYEARQRETNPGDGAGRGDGGNSRGSGAGTGSSGGGRGGGGRGR
ncbi:MAG: hypothetical protein Q8L93_05680 [Rhodocyclaceae bacterium]|nr:hypothetical protein [Rhodocyclaceae bacterium]MDP1957243.1 hypothetical protein [Rhodocyclaceae bacterium]